MEIGTESPLDLLNAPEPFHHLPFELYRRQAVVVTLSAPGIVEKIDAIEDISSCHIARGINSPLDLLPLQQLKEVLGHRIVVAVSSWAHRADKAVFFEEIATDLFFRWLRCNPLPRAVHVIKDATRPSGIQLIHQLDVLLAKRFYKGITRHKGDLQVGDAVA